MPKCELCGKDFTMITHSHLDRHCVTLSEYKERFPLAIMRDENYCDNDFRSRRISEAWWAKSQEERNEICRILSEAHKNTQKGRSTLSSLDEGVITLILEENFPTLWKYTGLLFHMENSRRKPDWTHTSLKKVIFYDSQYFHTEKDGESKKREMEAIGYSCLILTTDNLWNPEEGQNTIIRKVKEFMET